MKGGRNKIAGSLKARRGTLRPCRERPKRAPLARVPPPPERLPAPVKAIWAELALAVDSVGTFAEAYLAAFELAVEALAAARRAARAPRISPAALKAALQLAAGLMEGFGLSPRSRGQVPEAAPDDRTPAQRILDVVRG